MIDIEAYTPGRNDSVSSAADGRKAGVTVPVTEDGSASAFEMYVPLTDSFTGILHPGISMESERSEALEEKY